MDKTLLIATRNRHKLREFQAMLAASRVKLITLDDAPPIDEVDEDGLTFADNARKKAYLTAISAGYTCLADDSGLVVPSLRGRPGVYSARFAGPQATDAENNQKLLNMLKGSKGKERYGEFICAIAICDPQGNVHLAEGICPGIIAPDPAGEKGFGYDPLFIPCGYDRTFAQLTDEEKNQISHRSKALRQAFDILKKLNIID